MEPHRAELNLNFGVKLQMILLIKTKQFMFTTSVSINSGAIQPDGSLKFNFPTNISPSCTISTFILFKHLVTLQHFHLAFISPFSLEEAFFFPIWV